MANIELVCGVLRGFSFKKDSKDRVGFISRMTLGGVQLATDLAVRDPINPSSSQSVVAVLGGVKWGGGASDPIYLDAQLSVLNRQRVGMLLAVPDLPAIAVPFAFTVYEFDSLAEKYFKRMDSGGGELRGTVMSRSGVLDLNVADEASADVLSPVNFQFTVALAPQAIVQAVRLQSNTTDKVVKAWGVA